MSLARLGFGGLVEGAVAGGFEAVSIWDHTYRRAQQHEALGLADFGPVLADHGLRCTFVEGLFDWLSPPLPGTFMISTTHPEDELFALATASGATGVVAAHFGDPTPRGVAVEAFAAVCDRAREHGLTVALEYPAWATIGTFAEAGAVVEAADRPNGGLLVDTWHHVRGGADLAELHDVDPARILGIQLADGAAVQVGTLQDDAANRMLPGRGVFGLDRTLASLATAGVRCPVGPEVLDPSLNAQGPAVAGAALGDATRQVLPAHDDEQARRSGGNEEVAHG